MHPKPAARITRPIEYPTSDGKPMAETDLHRDLMIQLIDRLRTRYAARPNTYVSGNLLLCYVENDRRRHVAPDVFVVKGVPNRVRENYLLWEEGVAPQVVIELTSRTTRTEDMGRKRTLYQDVLRVAEYFLFDPLGDYLAPPLQGYRLRDGVYRRLPERGAERRLFSQELRLELVPVVRDLRLYEPRTQTWVETAAVIEQQRALAANQRASAAEERANAAEAEIARLRAALAQQLASPERTAGQ